MKIGLKMKNKKRKYYQVILMTVFAMITLSCDNEEYFELKNPPEFPWLTIDEYEMAAVSPYHLTFFDKGGGSWNDFVANDKVSEFIFSDISHWLGNQEGFMIDQLLSRTTDFIKDSQENAFKRCYKVIGVCNAALDFYYDNNGDPFPDATDEDKIHNVDRIAGELHFMRGHAYYYLVRRHSPFYDDPLAATEKVLPLRFTFPKEIEEAAEPLRATTHQIYDSIVSDFQRAKMLLPEKYNSNVHHPSYEHGRANRFAAAAMLARTYMLMGLYDDSDGTDNALKELNYIVNNGEYKLEANPLDAFNKTGRDESMENIWYALYSDPKMVDWSGALVTTKLYTLHNKTHYPAEGGGREENWSIVPWLQFSISYAALEDMNWMVDPENDDYSTTTEALNDKRYHQLYYRLEGYNGEQGADQTKYLVDSRHSQVENPVIVSDKYYRGNIGANTNFPQIRIAEIYLTRSIIRYKAGNLQGAADDLNIIRARAWDSQAADYEYVPVTADEITAEMIHNERIKEMSCEGDRLMYLMAMRLPVGPGDRKPSMENATINPPYENLYWRLPLDELNFYE